MRDRCNNPHCKDYKYYGGAGIKVSPLWDEFLDFKGWAYSNGYVKDSGLTIDRIDVHGNYEPENCRWVDRKTQANNMTTNHKILYNGEEHTLAEWSEIVDIPFAVLEARINAYHWDAKRALTTPVNAHRISYDVCGKRRTLKELAKDYGINYNTLYNRIFAYGYGIEKALGISV